MPGTVKTQRVTFDTAFGFIAGKGGAAPAATLSATGHKTDMDAVGPLAADMQNFSAELNQMAVGLCRNLPLRQRGVIAPADDP